MTSETLTRLPADEPGSREYGSIAAARDSTHGSRTGDRDLLDANRRLRLLIVDDDDADRLIMRRSLARSGLSLGIDDAATPAEALRQLRNGRYDCVFVDDRLPGMEAAGLLDAIDASAVILMTGNDDKGAPTLAAQDYLTKNELNAAAVRRALLAALEKAKLRHKLEERHAELESSRRELAQFARMTSRDLQEPLKIIVGFMQRLERHSGDNLDEQSREFMKQIVDGSMRMQRMVASLLELSLIGQSGETFERCAMGELLQEATANLRVVIADSGATISCDRLPEIACNRRRIVQLLRQLVDNAIRYRGPQPPEIRLCAKPVAVDAAERLSFASSARHQTIWQFCLEDNGVGVDPADAERIFVVFQRLRAGDLPEGSGMGLALCRKIIELHQGRIWAEARERGGSRICFTLPSEQP